MYELHSTHSNPEPDCICGTINPRVGEDICVTTYYQGWLPKWVAMGLHHYQVQCTFRSLDHHVRTDGPEYTLPVGYTVCVFDYDTQDWTQQYSEIPNLL